MTCLIGICFSFFFLLGCIGSPSIPPAPYSFDHPKTPLTDRQNSVIQTALSMLGTPYRFGGISPHGFDCSGFVKYVFKNSVNRSLPRLARDQIKRGQYVTIDQLKPADIVFFKIQKGKTTHVGIYLGQGKFIHAPSTGGKVNIQSLQTRYWSLRYKGGRRVI